MLLVLELGEPFFGVLVELDFGVKVADQI